MKKVVVFLLALAMFLTMSACGATKVLHCDGCGKEVSVDADSHMEEDWIVYCEACEKELGLDNIIDEK